VGALIGPLIAVISFRLLGRQHPLGRVLWRGGISFGGVIAFIFADLVILPILNIYRKYYGARVSVYLFVVSYAAMVSAGLVIGLIFNIAGAVPTNRNIIVFDTTISWNYDTFSQHRLSSLHRWSFGALLPHRRSGNAPGDGDPP